MKKLLLIAIIAIASCKKESVNRPEPTATTEPSITSYTFSSVRDGGEQRPQFIVNVISDTNTVNRLELYCVPARLVWYVDKPKTGRYAMYDHLSTYPNFEQYQFYYFLFKKKDGSKVQTEPFQVY